MHYAHVVFVMLLLLYCTLHTDLSYGLILELQGWQKKRNRRRSIRVATSGKIAICNKEMKKWGYLG